MASHTGSEGLVKLTSTSGDTVGELTSWTLSASAEVIDATILSSAAKVTKAGGKSYTGSVEMFWDEGDTAQTSIQEGAELAFVFLPEGGDVSGDISWTVTGIVDSLEFGAAVDGMVTASASFASNGALTRGTVA